MPYRCLTILKSDNIKANKVAPLLKTTRVAEEQTPVHTSHTAMDCSGPMLACNTPRVAFWCCHQAPGTITAAKTARSHHTLLRHLSCWRTSWPRSSYRPATSHPCSFVTRFSTGLLAAFFPQLPWLCSTSFASWDGTTERGLKTYLMPWHCSSFAILPSLQSNHCIMGWAKSTTYVLHINWQGTPTRVWGSLSGWSISHLQWIWQKWPFWRVN